MYKETKRRVFNTATATVVKRVMHGHYGEPDGYETTMFITPEGDYFLFTNGGADSPYKKENIRYYTKKNALKWLEEN